MKKIFFLILEILSCFFLYAQKRPRLEILPLMSYDNYSTISHRSMSGYDTDFIKMKGLSFGLNAYYKIPLNSQFFIKPGIGFYRYSFNTISRTKIHKEEVNDDRYIHYVNPLLMDAYTNKYFYNSLSLNVSIERSFKASTTSDLYTGFFLENYINFNQRYSLQKVENDKLYGNSWRYFGSTVGLYFSYIKMINQFSVGPTMAVPVYSLWGQDALFPNETNSGFRNKWFNSVRLGCTLSYQFQKQKTSSFK